MLSSNTVTACLTVLSRRAAHQPVDDDLAVLVDRYQRLVPAPGLTVFSVRLGLSVLDAAEGTEHPGVRDVAATLIQRAHGIVFKWAVNGFVRGVHGEMVGSHPIVTEEAKNLTVTGNHLEGSWNKGKGGNGYFRGSRVWDSLYAGNTTRDLRHFTFQWSASGNVVIGNSFDSDLNLHGGWERNNLFEPNHVSTPYAHRPANCKDNCGDEGNSGPDNSNWFPIWWAAGLKAVKWSGSSGPNNVFFNNTLKKQLGTIYSPYSDYCNDPNRVFRFGVSGGSFHHLDVGGAPISDWAHNEQHNYSGAHGIDSTQTDGAESLFLSTVP